MKDMVRKTLIWWTLSLLGFGVLTICYILAWQGTISYFLFWTGLSIGCFSLLIVMFLNKDKPLKVLLALFVLGLIIYSLQIFRTPDYFLDRDEMIHYQAYTTLMEKGSVNIPHTTYSVIQNYPGLELLIASTALVTNLDPMISGKILIGIIHSFLLVLLWLFLSNIGLSNNLASLSAFIYALNTRYPRFDAMVSYESLGLFLVFLSFLLIQKKITKGSRAVSILNIIVLGSVVITHHLSSYFLFLFGIIVCLVQLGLQLKNEKFKKDAKAYIYVILSGVMVFGWLIYSANTSQSFLILGFRERILEFLSLSIFGGQGGREMLAGSQVPFFEKLIDSYLYPPVLLVFCVIGGYYLLFREKESVFKYTLLIYGPILFLASWILIPTSLSGSELAYRSWAFLFVGVAFTISFGFKLIMEKRSLLHNSFLVFSLIVIFTGGISIARNETFRFPGSFSFVDDNTFYTLQMFRSADWLGNNHGKRLQIAGTFPAKDVLGSYGTQFVDASSIVHLIFNNELDKELWKKLDYLAIDYRICSLTYSTKTKRTPNAAYYFGAELPDQFGDIGFTKPVPLNMVDKFNDLPEMQRVYNNGTMFLYKNTMKQ